MYLPNSTVKVDTMTKQTLNAQVEQLPDGLDSQEEIAEATKLLHNRFFERSMNAELDDHLSYSKHKPGTNSNSRNGSTRKRLQTEDGSLEIDTPRDQCHSGQTTFFDVGSPQNARLEYFTDIVRYSLTSLFKLSDQVPTFTLK